MVRSARASIFVTLAAVTAGCLPAQQPTYGSAADLEQFATALNEYRYSDLAEEVISTGITNGVQDPNGFLAYALCEIRAAGAFRTSDATARTAKIKEAVSSYEDFLKKFPTGKRAAEARVKLAEVLRLGGEAVATAIKKEPDAAKKEALKAEGLNLFTKAEVLSKARIDEINRIPKPQWTEENQAEYFVLRFTVARLSFSKALLYENRDGVEAQSLLNDAQSQLEELDIDLPQGHPIVFEVRRLLALIQVEQKKIPQAEETLSQTCSELEGAVKADPSIVKDIPENQEVRDLIARMFLEKAEFLTQTKKPADWKGALDTTDTLNKIIPDLVKLKDGKQALIILAQALGEDGKNDQARAVAKKVFDHDPSGDAGVKARELLDKLGVGGGADLPGLIKLLIGICDRGEVSQAERIAARILVHADAKANPESQVDALFLLADLYGTKGLYVYSSVIYGAIAEEFPASKRAPEAKFAEAIAYARQSQIDGRQAQKYWKDKSRTARSDLISKFGSSKEAQDVSWFAAQDAELEEKFPEAIDLYLKVSSTSPKYAEAQHKAATLAFDLATAAKNRNKADEAVMRYKQTEGGLKNAIASFDAAAKTTINAADVARLKGSSFSARLLLAGVYIQKEMKKPEEALKVLDQVEAEFKDDKDRLGKIWSLRIKTLMQLGRASETIELVDKQLEIATPETLVGVAAVIEQEAREKLKVNEKDADVPALLKHAAKFYSKAVDKSGGVGGGKIDWNLVGQRLLVIGARLSKLSDDLSLQSIEPGAPISEKSTIEHAKKALEMTSPGTDIVDLDRARAIAFAAAATDKWIDAVQTLKEVTDKKDLQLFDSGYKLNREVAQKYPRLADVYQDLAVAYIRASKGQSSSAKAYCDNAKDILVKLIKNSPPDSKRYWDARYLHLEALMTAKENVELDATLDGLARTAPDADNDKFGIKTKINQIRALRNKPISNDPTAPNKD